MAADGSGNPSAAVTNMEYMRAYCTLFAAHWFGARRFDRANKQETFDPADVMAYLAQSEKSAYLMKNFTRSRVVLQALPAEAQANSQDMARGEQQAHSTEAAQDGGGVAGVGDVVIANGAESAQEQDREPSQPSEVAKIESRKQIFPTFVVLQCSFIFALWAIFALKRVASKELTLTSHDLWIAGFDNLSPGNTDLRWSGRNCEDHRPQIWRWVTYQWTHVGFGPLLANIGLLIFLGTPLEGHEGTLRMFTFFNVGVIAGALSFFVFNSHGYVVGSSGGVYALIGLHLAHLIMNWREKAFRVADLAILLVLPFLCSLAQEWWGKADISYAVGLGGCVAGVIMSTFVEVGYKVTRWEKARTGLCSLLGLLLVLFCVNWLATNEAPLNIWEAAAGENGYCWYRQIYNISINPSSYQCVRCGSEACINTWSQQRKILRVSFKECDAAGWYYDGR